VVLDVDAHMNQRCINREVWTLGLTHAGVNQRVGLSVRLEGSTYHRVWRLPLQAG
jgi:hypothetical protein